MKLKDKVAIITGASSGIGYGIGVKFGQEGANVCLVGNTHYDKAKELAEQIKKDGGKAIAVKADLLNMKDIDNIVDATVNEFGRIDILVNDAINFLEKHQSELHEKVLFLASQGEVRQVIRIMRMGKIPMLESAGD